MRSCITGNERAKIGIGYPVEKPCAQNAGSQPALAGDHQHAACAERRLPQDEVDNLVMRSVLRVAMKIEPRIDLVLAAADAALAGEIFRQRRLALPRLHRLPRPRGVDANRWR
jgi:hypothetical protein